MSRLTRDFLQREYWEQGKSPYQIAEEVGTYPNAVRRELLRHWASLRTKAEAQANALRTGRQTHPTAGVGHSDDARDKIRLTKLSNLIELNMDTPACSQSHPGESDEHGDGHEVAPQETPEGV